jgi:transposase
MSTTDAPPRDWREGRRLRALELSERGWKAIRIAEALGVPRGAVSQWLGRARAGGREAVWHRKPPGARPRLTVEQRAQLPPLLAKGADGYDFIGTVWTTTRVAAVITRAFGVSSHPAHGSRLLRSVLW